MTEQRPYTVSYDPRSETWYAHRKGFAYIPVAGSFSFRKSDAMEYAKLYNNLPNRVKEIEQKKREDFQKCLM